jgi:hypothetical protein
MTLVFDAVHWLRARFGWNIGCWLEQGTVNGFYAWQRIQIDSAILSAYSQAAFERVARKYAFGPTAWMFQNIGGLLLALVLLAGALGIIAVAARQSLLDSYGTRVTGVVKHRALRTNSFGQKIKWQTLDYKFTTEGGATIEARLDRPVRELSGVLDHDRLVVVYWNRFPDINAPRGVRRGGGALIVLGVLFMLGGVHCLCFVRRGIRWRRSLLSASASSGQDKSRQLPHVVKNDGGAGGA